MSLSTREMAAIRELKRRSGHLSRLERLLVEAIVEIGRVQSAAESSPVPHLRVPHFPMLTTRENEVLQLIVEGNSNREAAKILGISDRTVEVHRTRVLEKFSAKSTADLVRMTMEAAAAAATAATPEARATGP